MVFVRDGRAEQREDSVAGGLHDVTVVAMDRVDHQLERRIDDCARFFGIEAFHQIHRALDVGEQGGHGLALAARGVGGGLFESDADRLLDDGCRWLRAGGGSPSGRQCSAAFAAEFEFRWIVEAAARAFEAKCGPAVAAELYSGGIIGCASCASHWG